MPHEDSFMINIQCFHCFSSCREIQDCQRPWTPQFHDPGRGQTEHIEQLKISNMDLIQQGETLKKKSKSGNVSVVWCRVFRLMNASYPVLSSAIQRHPGPPCADLRASGTKRRTHSCLAGFREKVQSIECPLERAQFQHQISDGCHSTDYISEEDLTVILCNTSLMA